MKKLALLTLLTIFCSLLTNNTLSAQITQPSTQVITASENINYETVLSEQNTSPDTNNYNATHKPVEDDDDVDFSTLIIVVAGGRQTSSSNNKGNAPQLFKFSLYANGDYAEHNTYIGHTNTSRNDVNITNITLVTNPKSTESLGTFTGSFPIASTLIAGKVYTSIIQYQVGLTGKIQSKTVNFTISSNSKVATDSGVTTILNNDLSTSVKSLSSNNSSTYKHLQTVIKGSKAFPNPFNERTVISYNLEEDSPVTVNIFNNLGQLVATIINNEYQTKGIQTATWSSGLWSLPKGIYYCNIQASNELHSIKLVKTK